MVPRLVAFLRRQPRWILIVIGLLWVAVLAALDYVAPLELSFLTFYVAPVLFLVWFVGPAAGFLGAAVCAAFWVWEDVLSAHAHPMLKLQVTDWNLAIRAMFLALFVWVVAELKRALERERHLAQERLEHDVQIAEEVQTRLFPRRDPEIRGLDCHGLCRPARGVAGDYYDFLPLEPGRTGIAVGDVTGKGLPAALLMASLQGSLRSLVTLSKNGPASLAADLNTQLHSLTESNRFATFFWAVFDEQPRSLTWVNAGHNAPMLLRTSGAVERLGPSGPPLGAIPAGRLPAGDHDAFAGRRPRHLHRRRHGGGRRFRSGVRRGTAGADPPRRWQGHRNRRRPLRPDRLGRPHFRGRGAPER